VLPFTVNYQDESKKEGLNVSVNNVVRGVGIGYKPIPVLLNVSARQLRIKEDLTGVETGTWPVECVISVQASSSSKLRAAVGTPEDDPAEAEVAL
jgi:hypothetical protein